LEVGLPDPGQRADILRVILKDAILESGFFGPGFDSPVSKVARATERQGLTRQLLSSTYAVWDSEPFCVQIVTTYDPYIY